MAYAGHADAPVTLEEKRRAALEAAEKAAEERLNIIADHIINGVIVIDPRNTYIEEGVKIGKGTEIFPGTYIHGGVEIGERCRIGPFAYIRPGSKIGNGVKIGDFVEVKNAVVGDNTKMSHLTYVGDAEVGAGINFGCGSVVVNYDGRRKHRTVIGDGAFIGCNANLVAPVSVAGGAFIAAGSTITEDVPENALGIARARQINKDGWGRP
jgi:bifunctional UDP-N-acetylglucosamine pyrophosphorylase/glucosamine-1-phosphate N-acetyltransferase